MHVVVVSSRADRHVEQVGIDEVYVPDVKSAAFYDAAVDDVTVDTASPAVHTAMLVRVPHPDATRAGVASGVLVKVMRGWDTEPAAFPADDVTMLRHLATAAAQVRVDSTKRSRACCLR